MQWWLGALVVAGLLGIASGATAQIPAPADVFGFEPGTDYRLADYQQIVDYFAALDAASDRIVVQEIGRSTLGRPLLLAMISSASNLRERDRYRAISARLATARDPDSIRAMEDANAGRAVVWVDGGLHATEVAHGQFTPVFAHWLVADDGEEARRIRDNVIVLLMPNMNPDGLEIVVQWYRRHVGTPFETSPVPELYHHYIGHDNNRDWYMFTQVETQAVARQLYHEWFPQIVYNHHQSGPFPGRIWVPPFENPVNPNLDPLIVSGINQLGETMKQRFAREGRPGVSSGVVYDMWWNGSMRGAPDFHNMLGFLTETALYRYATPHCYEESDIPDTFGARAGHLPAKRPSTQYIEPWLGGCWRLRDPIEYMMTATRAVVDLAARRRSDYLMDIYRMGRRQIARAHRGEGGPFAYVIDVEAQHDRSAAVALLRTFRRGGVEIRRADQTFRVGGRTFPAGTYVIPPQAFRPFVVDLMEPKTYPDRRQYPGGPPDPPYDMTGYELRLQMGVSAHGITEPFPIPRRIVVTVPQPDGAVFGRGDTYLLRATENTAAIGINRALAEGARVRRSAEAFEAAGYRWAPGTFVLTGVERDRVERLAAELGLQFGAVDGTMLRIPDGAPVRSPRIGIYTSFVANMPTGWTRWMLDQYEFRYDNLWDLDIHETDLSDYDIILIADQDRESLETGHSADVMPSRYAGGLGTEGARALGEYVRNGGRLVATGEAVDYAIALFGLPVRNAVAGLAPDEFFIPGSLINLDLDPTQLAAHGMPNRGIAFFVRSQALEVDGDADGVDVFARYASEPLASGWANGADRYIANRAAGLRAVVGRGDVVLFAFDPYFRGQPHNTFKLFFNVLYSAAAE